MWHTTYIACSKKKKNQISSEQNKQKVFSLCGLFGSSPADGVPVSGDSFHKTDDFVGHQLCYSQAGAKSCLQY